MKVEDILVEKYMGSKGDVVAVRPQGTGSSQTFRLINRDNHNMVDMMFDTDRDAKLYAEKKGMTVDNSSLDE